MWRSEVNNGHLPRLSSLTGIHLQAWLLSKYFLKLSGIITVGGGTYAIVHVWRTGNRFAEFAFSFYFYKGSGANQVVRPAWLKSLPIGPFFWTSQCFNDFYLFHICQYSSGIFL